MDHRVGLNPFRGRRCSGASTHWGSGKAPDGGGKEKGCSAFGRSRGDERGKTGHRGNARHGVSECCGAREAG